MGTVSPDPLAYTARMNNLMVKECDMGLSAESWVLLDMQRGSHVGDDPVDNSEELCVKTAASLLARFDELSHARGPGHQRRPELADAAPGPDPATWAT